MEWGLALSNGKQKRSQINNFPDLLFIKILKTLENKTF